MVAAMGAPRVSDAHVAAELAALVHTRGLIADPRWRLDAAAALVPALHRFGAALDGVTMEVRAGLAGATCPRALAPLFAELVEILLAGGEVPGVIDALYTRSVAGAAFAGVEAALRAGATALARRIAAAVPEHHAALCDAIGTGVVDGRFVARSDDPAAEYPPSLALVTALVDAVVRTGDPRRAAEATRVVAGLPLPQRPLGVAQLARATLALYGVPAALARVRAIRPRGPRAGAGLLLTTAALAAGDVAAARAIADATESDLFRQRAALAIAHHLAAAGDAVGALRALAPVRSRALVAERRLLHTEIRLVARRMTARLDTPDRAQLAAAVAAPAWTELGPARLEPARRLRQLHAVFNLMIHLTRRPFAVFADGAATWMRRSLGDARSRRAFLRLLRGLDLDVRDAIMTVRNRLPVAVTSALWAEHLRERTEALVRWSPPPVVCSPEHARRAAADSLERALHDEAVARSPDGPRKRRVLTAAARYCLRTALAAPTPASAAVVDARLRSLLYLGGALARDALVDALTTPIADAAPHILTRVLEALCVLDPLEAVRIAFASAPELAAAGVDVDRVLAVAELHGGVASGFARAWAKARRRLAGVDGIRWLAALAVDSVGAGAPLTPDVLGWIADQRVLPPTPAALVAELAGATATLATVPLDRVAATVAHDRDLLERLLVARPARVDPAMPAWDLARWVMLFDYAAAQPIAIHAPTVERAARAVPSATAAFRAGDLAKAGVPVTTPFTADEPFVLRLLDKRADLLTFLRLADVPLYSCYRTDSGYWADGKYDTRDAVLALWRDPLAFCFRIERGAERRPSGFVFGGFAGMVDRPGAAIVLNGLYVRPRRAKVRDAVLRAVETALAPLGTYPIAIANEHGGYGPLPDRYREGEAQLLRFRALAIAGQPVTRCYDDISTTINRTVTCDHLYWL